MEEQLKNEAELGQRLLNAIQEFTEFHEMSTCQILGVLETTKFIVQHSDEEINEDPNLN